MVCDHEAKSENPSPEATLPKDEDSEGRGQTKEFQVFLFVMEVKC